MATKARILQAAYSQFCQIGYLPSTMESIAADARVATQTVYYVFGTKAQLLREVAEAAAAGLPDPAPVMDREWMQEALASSDPRRSVALVVEHGVDIYARVAPLLQAIQAAASVDEGINTYWRSVRDARRSGMRKFVATMEASGSLRPGLDAQRAAEILFVVNSHETFLGLTRDAGWDLEEFKAWLYETLCHQLLEPGSLVEGPSRSRPTKELSFDAFTPDG